MFNLQAPYLTSNYPKADRVYNIMIRPEGESRFMEVNVEGYDYGTDVMQTVISKYGENTEFSGYNPYDFCDIRDFGRKERGGKQMKESNLKEARNMDASPKKYLYQLCDKLGWKVPIFTDSVVGGYRLRYDEDPITETSCMTKERAEQYLADAKRAAAELGFELVKGILKPLGRRKAFWFEPDTSKWTSMEDEMWEAAEEAGLAIETITLPGGAKTLELDLDNIDKDSVEYKNFLDEWMPEAYQLFIVVPGNQKRNQMHEETVRVEEKRGTALDRYKELDDQVDEAFDLPQTVYSVSYVVNHGPYQAIMVRADSEEEAIEKFKKQNPDAEVLAAGIEYDPEEMRRRGKPLMEEITDDISVRDWYMTAFPHDTLGYELNTKIKFDDIQKALDNGDPDIYTLLGVEDSIVRERLFDKLSELTGVAYDDIYEKWENSLHED